MSAPSARRAIISSIFGPASSPVASWKRARKRASCFGSCCALSSIPSISAASESMTPAMRSSSSPASGSSPSPSISPAPPDFPPEIAAKRDGLRSRSGRAHCGHAGFAAVSMRDEKKLKTVWQSGQ